MKYVIMKSGFGNIWIGKFDETKVGLPDYAKAFDEYDDALEEALALNDSIDNQDELEDITEDEIDELDDGMTKWIL